MYILLDYSTRFMYLPFAIFMCVFFINSILSVLSMCDSNLASTSKRGRKHQTNRPTKEDTIRKLCEMYLVQLIEFNVKLEDGKHSEHTEIRQSDFRINCVFFIMVVVVVYYGRIRSV